MPITTSRLLRSPRRAALLPALLTLVHAGRVAAQAAPSSLAARDVDVPSRGLSLPGESLTGEASALSLETNPAQLAFLRGADAVWVSNLWSRDAALPGRGHGFFLGLPLGPLGLGADLMDVFGQSAGPAHRWRFSLGAGLALGDRLALGASWHRIFDHRDGAFSAFDLGASLRLTNPLAIAVTLEDLNRPGSSPRRWTGELLLRPLSSRTLELGAGFRKNGGSSWSDGTPHLLVRWSPPAPVSFFANASLPWRTSPVAGGERDVLLAAGVTFSTESLRLRGALLDAEVDDATRTQSPGRWGGSIAVGLSSVQGPKLGDQVARLECRGLGSERAFLGFVTTLERVAHDPSVVALYLRVKDLDIGLGRVEELRDRLQSLRARGLRVFIHLDSADKKQMYLALAADRIFLHPLGQIVLGGFSANRLWWKGAMDKLGIRGELVRIAEYKGAMEPFVYDTETDAVRANVEAVVDDDYQRYVAAFVRERPAAAPTPAAAETLLAQGLLLPAEAKKAGLVDAVVDERDGEDAVRAALGRSRLPVRDWHHDTKVPARWFGSRVAVVLVEGTITDEDPDGLPLGRSTGTSAATLVKELEKLESDPQVRAVLVRVNSGGGSAFASERIARALLRLKEKGRPVVVSFGDIAASGGYYAATAGDLVFAEPSTMTGSIGVFAFKVDASALMTRLGVYEERASRGVPAEPFSPYHPWTADEKRGVERSITAIYQTFLSRVVSARGKKGLDAAAKVDAVARGHVWTGSQAASLGLVDHRGDFLRALEAAAALGNVPRDDQGLPRMRFLPSEDWRKQLFKRVGAEAWGGLREAVAGDDDELDQEPARNEPLGGTELSSPGDLVARGLRAFAPWLRLPDAAGIQMALPYSLTVE